MVTICIATYGEERWRLLARKRALPTALGAQVIVHHEPKGTIAEARNEAAWQAAAGWLCFLDADDELAPGYIKAMEAAIVSNPERPALFTPAVSYVVNGKRMMPKFWRRVPLHKHNWLVIGTVIERDFFFSIGGFKDYGDPPGSNAYEDWSLWSRAEKEGAAIVKVPDAVYVAHQEPDGRHRRPGSESRLWHQEIGRDVWPEHYPKEAR